MLATFGIRPAGLRLGLLALPLLAPASFAQTPDAGQDRTVPHGVPAKVAGSVANGAPLEWWTADGNGPTENKLIKYKDGAGVSAVGPLLDSMGNVFGFPTDLVEIGGTVWGVDAQRRQIYTLDTDTGLVSPVGPQWTTHYSDVHSLAWDPVGDRLFAVDILRKQLLIIDRTTGSLSLVGVNSLSAYVLIRSLAWRDSDSMLYAVDDATSLLIRIDPSTGAPAPVVALANDPSARIDELQFVGERLFAVNLYIQGGTPSVGELQEVDLATGSAQVLPPLLGQVSSHCLLLKGLRDETLWSQVSGPGVASFVHAERLTTAVTFDQPGAYVLQLALPGVVGQPSDTVTVVSDPSPLPGNVAFCFGDLSGPPCRCGNAGGDGEGCANSTSAGSRLQNLGGTSVSLDDARLVASQLPADKFGIVYLGTAPASGGLGNLLGDGLRCVAGSTVRYPVANSGPGGSFEVLGIAAGSQGMVVAGATIYFQAWHRDDTLPCGFQSNLTNGLAITFQP